jgi:HSP20 family protein
MAANIVRFDPFEDLSRLQREVNRLFEDNGRPGGNRAAENVSQRTWTPAVDIYEDASKIVLRAELAGLSQDEIDIELTGDTLTIKGDRKFDENERREGYVRIERSYGPFQRAFTIGIPVDADAVKASYRDGILEIQLPKSEETRPKKVQVTTG